MTLPTPPPATSPVCDGPQLLLMNSLGSATRCQDKVSDSSHCSKGGLELGILSHLQLQSPEILSIFHAWSYSTPGWNPGLPTHSPYISISVQHFFSHFGFALIFDLYGCFIRKYVLTTCVTDGCERPCGYWKQNQGPLVEQAKALKPLSHLPRTFFHSTL